VVTEGAAGFMLRVAGLGFSVWDVEVGVQGVRCRVYGVGCVV